MRLVGLRLPLAYSRQVAHIRRPQSDSDPVRGSSQALSDERITSLEGFYSRYWHQLEACPMDTNILVEKLRRDIESGRVVTIAGTGVSVATCANASIDGEQVATWRGLLLHGVTHWQSIGAADAAVAQIL